MKVLFLRI